MKYEDLSQHMVSMLKSYGVYWDEFKRVYFTKLHKDFYLKETEVRSEEHLQEFCNLIRFLKEHLEYGVSTEWGDSELNKYVYRLNKEKLKGQFPYTIDALSRFYDDSDIISFYKKTLKAKDPTIIDLIGTTGAGKTTFCQQFVDQEGKEILEKTITPAGNSTIIQTDIVILEDTNSRLFLKARAKRDLVRDIILVALNIDPEYTFNLKKNINDDVNKKGLKKSLENKIKVESEILQGVYNLFRTEKLMKEFLEISEQLQNRLEDTEEEIQDFINNNTENTILITFLENIIKEQLNIDNFFGYRHEVPLDSEYILEKTIIPTRNFNKFKDREEEFIDIISFRILFDQAVIVLNCDEKAKEKLPQKFRKGIVFRDSQGHKKSEQVGIATDFEVKNKILLIPAGVGGELVDDKYVEELKNILISEAKQNVVVITKLDKTAPYEYYEQGEYAEFIEYLKDQVVTTHNNLIDRLEDTEELDTDQFYQFDRNAVTKKFIEAFDNAYLSKVKKVKGEFDVELHKIVCKNKYSQEITSSDIEDIKMLDSWYELISGILERERRISYDEGGLILKHMDTNKRFEAVSSLAKKMESMLEVCYDKIKWQKELDDALGLYSADFRNIYHELYIWNNRSINSDISSSGYEIEEKAGKLVKFINSLVLKSDNSQNAVEAILESVLVEYLDECYTFDKRLNVRRIAKKIISNAINRAAIISYKLYDRDVMNNGSTENIRKIYNQPANYVQPPHPLKNYDVYKRSYYTDTAFFLGIYCNLLAKFKTNLESHFVDMFKTVIETELEKLEAKVQ